MSAAGKLSKLAMDYASRMKRAKDMGLDTDLYHGSTHDITAFGGGNYEKGGHFGGSNYFTSSADDASRHYAGEGPDLTNRLQSRAEQIADELDIPYDSPEALKRARIELKGGNDGVIYPVKARTGKQFNIADDDTFLEYDRAVPAWEDYLDDAAGDEDIARELAEEASWDNEPEGELADFIESISNQADEHGFDADELIGRIKEEAYGGGINASKLDDIMRNTEWYAEDYNGGDLINNEVYRQAIQEAGYDSIKHSANIFNGMDVDYGTAHTIIFDPKNIRSVNAAFDPAQKESSNLLASLGAGVTAGGAMLSSDDSMAALAQRANEDRAMRIEGVKRPIAGKLAGYAGDYNSYIERNPLLGFIAPEAPQEVLSKLAYDDKRSYWDYLKASIGMM